MGNDSRSKAYNGKPRTIKKQSASKPRRPAKRKAHATSVFCSRDQLFLALLETISLGSSALLGTILTLGSTAHLFSGLSLFENLLPFAAGIAVWILLTAGLLLGWIKLRGWLKQKLMALPALAAISLSIASIWLVFQTDYTEVFTDFRNLVGGKQQAAQITLAHQVYAAYRRHEQAELQKMLDNAAPYNHDIQLAAQTFSVDMNLLQGIAAAESSFIPRTSHDGGKGLFQITAVPKSILLLASEHLAIKTLDLANPRHNAFVAAATLKHYLAEMQNDLFLGLLAYNIGPRNGGLRFIMQQYGASDFVSMQPYLQQLPRDYPIRVLSYALAFKIRQHDGKLMSYQEGNNAKHIQSLGIPGLEMSY